MGVSIGARGVHRSALARDVRHHDPLPADLPAAHRAREGGTSNRGVPLLQTPGR